MKTIVILMILAMLTGCGTPNNHYNLGRAMQEFNVRWQENRRRSEDRRLQRAQTTYYETQNMNAWRNY